MKTLVVLPILVPLVSAAAVLAAWRSLRVQRAISLLGAAALLVAALHLGWAVLVRGVIAVQVGGWPAPFGITLAADMLSALMVVLAGVTGLAVAVYSLAEVDRPRQSSGFHPLFHVLMAGVCGAFLTGDIFNLYVCFEVMLIASFVLLALGGERGQMEGALKYVTLNLVSSAFFLAAVGVLYGVTRSLNMADLSGRTAQAAETHPHLVLSIAGLLLVSFGIKAAIFPLYFWLPSSYHTPPVSVSAVFAGLLTKVGVYALIRVFTLVFTEAGPIYRLLLVLAGLTMLAGVLGAVSQYHIRRILGFHIISQIGYMVMGLGLLASPDAAVRRLGLAASVFYIAHHIVVKTNLFLVGGIVRRLRGTEELRETGGLAVASPWLAALFLVPAFSLAGIPPLSGFWAKLAMIRAGLEAGAWVVVAAAVAAGLLTLMSMIKIWNEAFWKPNPADTGEKEAAASGKHHQTVGESATDEGAAMSPSTDAGGTVDGDEGNGDETPRLGRRHGRLSLMVAPVVLLALITIFIGLCPQLLLDYAFRAAEQLLDPTVYLQAVGAASGLGSASGGAAP